LFLRAISLDEKAFGPGSAELGTDLNNLGLLYVFMKRYDEAAKVYDRALTIRLHELGNHDAETAQTMSGYALALRGLHRDAEAQQMQARAEAITSSASSAAK
jgi:tetratricopeptide (TPR) repeat protein